MVLAPSAEQATCWRQRNGLAPTDVVIDDTSSPHVPTALAPEPLLEVVLLDGWRRGPYAERHSWQLARQGFDFSPPDSVPAPRGVSPRAMPVRRGRPDTLVGQAAGRIGDQLVDDLSDRCELAHVVVTAVVRLPDGSLLASTSSATPANGWGSRRAA